LTPLPPRYHHVMFLLPIGRGSNTVTLSFYLSVRRFACQQTQIEYNKAKYTYERTQEEAILLLRESIKQVNQDTLVRVRVSRCFVLPRSSRTRVTCSHDTRDRVVPSSLVSLVVASHHQS
jgi:hypothetical protein